jgi:hypothetical protein
MVYRNKICKYTQIHIISRLILDNQRNGISFYSEGGGCMLRQPNIRCVETEMILLCVHFFCYLVFFCSQRLCSWIRACICRKYKLRTCYHVGFIFLSIIFWLFHSWMTCACLLFCIFVPCVLLHLSFCASFLQYNTLNYSAVKENRRIKYFKSYVKRRWPF